MKNIRFILVILVFSFCTSGITVNAQRHKHHKVNKQHKVNRHNPNYRYAKMPQWGYAYKVAPKNAFIYRHSGIRYHYYRGVYYKPAGTKYMVVRAPVGIRLRTLPKESIHFVLGGRRFFYYYGTYYVKSVDDSEYITVNPPLGARVDALPDGYRKVIYNEKTFYKFEGTYYKAVVDDNGEVWYQVVKEK